jgi:hypothetical protein
MRTLIRFAAFEVVLFAAFCGGLSACRKGEQPQWKYKVTHVQPIAANSDEYYANKVWVKEGGCVEFFYGSQSTENPDGVVCGNVKVERLR